MTDAFPFAARIVGAGFVGVSDDGASDADTRRAAFEPTDLPGGLGRRLGRQPALVFAAILQALGGATPDPDTALVLGTAHGAMSETIDVIAGAAKHGAAAASPLLFANSLHNAMSGAVGRALGLRGPAVVVSNGDASFQSALVTAMAMLRAGHARRAIVGASDSVHPVYTEGLRRVGLLPAPGRPAYAGGEGGGALVIEAAAAGDVRTAVTHAAFGEAVPRSGRLAAAQSMTSGERRDAARHSAVWERVRAAFDGPHPEPAHAAARFGTFGSLCAVAVAAEAIRRFDCDAVGGATAFVQASLRAPPTVVVVGGHGR
ncbi:MAG: beta-ketoacyl synthase chain length factor [Planctomycetes bacterium]|nr:beta-ketoacyl synthase chain length factor [Planctomycetota bacterium]